MRVRLAASFFDRRRWRAPRRLTLTRAGWLVTAVSLALGLAAIRSGNNPLFFLWGTILGGMVLSGVLSEACLRPLQARAQMAGAVRVGEPAQVILHVHNASRVWPAFALSWTVRVRDGAGAHVLEAPYVLRLDQQQRRRLWASFVPQARGAVALESTSAKTAYPFGLFVKERPFLLEGKSTFVRPARVSTDHWLETSRRHAVGIGRAQASAGDDFGHLRAFRTGDPLKRVLWRRAAATGRWLVAETQSERANSLILYVRLQSRPRATAAEEHTLALAGSVAEKLIERGVAVGLWTHGAALPASSAPEQAGAILDALARVQAHVPVPKERPRGDTVVPLAECPAAASASPTASVA